MAASFFGITVTASLSVTWKLRLKKLNFTQNGGERLKLKILKLKQQRVQIYTEAELAKATNNYDDSNKLRDDSFSSVHKGKIKRDNVDVVVVKKPKDVHKSRVKGDFRWELQTLMKINHKNLVELRGMCLETRIPLLVYEYIPNCTTLFERISQDASTLSWEDRFRIATEAALAINYMHSNIRPPLIHGNIKSANILLDENGLVKLSDFGTSVLILQVDRRIVATQKPEASAYIDPEYWITHGLTTKSDVYSFGVVLVELLMGEIVCAPKSEESINNIHRFISSVKDEIYWDVINYEGDSEDEKERVIMVAKIAVECLDQNSVNRPAMSKVAQDLDPSSIAEEKNEDIEDEGEEDTFLSNAGEKSQDCMSSCLSCLGLDPASCFCP